MTSIPIKVEPANKFYGIILMARIFSSNCMSFSIEVYKHYIYIYIYIYIPDMVGMIMIGHWMKQNM